MLSQRQIAAAGFMGVYAGCVALTVNLYRLPYRRGAFVGVFFGATIHLMLALFYIWIALTIGAFMGDPLLKTKAVWCVIAAVYLVCQVLSAIGTTIMGRYFDAPRTRKQAFDRHALYAKLKARDNDKTSVLHDVVQRIENTPEPALLRFSNGWIVLWSLMSVAVHYYWYIAIFRACVDAVYFGVSVDASWWLSLIGCFVIGLVVLIAGNFASIAWLNRDIHG